MISPSWPSIGRRASAFPGIRPVVPLEAHRLAQDGHELVLDEPIDLGAVLLIEMVMTDDGEHGTSWVSRICELSVIIPGRVEHVEHGAGGDGAGGVALVGRYIEDLARTK